MADRHTTEKLLEGERLSGKVTLFAKVTILPGDELPYHEHHGETEAYHILSGAGMYQDNDKTYPVQAGMTTFCEDGSGHAVSCAGEEPLVFLANDSEKSRISRYGYEQKEKAQNGIPLLRSAGKMPGAGAAGRKMVAELWVPD